MHLCTQFATFDDIVAATLRALIGATTLPRGLVDDLAGPFIATLPSPQSQDRMIDQAFAGVDWRWPWFEEWAERFRTLGLTPYVWRQVRQRMASGTTRVEDADIRPRILAHTASMIAYSAQHIAGWSRIDNRSFGSEWHYRWPRIEIVLGCDAEELAGREAWPAIHDGDLRTLPPFFPGDRTSFTVRNDRGMLRYGWAGPAWLNVPTNPLPQSVFNELLDSLARGQWHRA